MFSCHCLVNKRPVLLRIASLLIFILKKRVVLGIFHFSLPGMETAFLFHCYGDYDGYDLVIAISVIRESLDEAFCSSFLLFTWFTVVFFAVR